MEENSNARPTIHTTINDLFTDSVPSRYLRLLLDQPLVRYDHAHPIAFYDCGNWILVQMPADRKPFPEFLRGFEETIQSSAARLLTLTDDHRGERRSNDSWTRKQILGHLIDSAANNHQRFVRAQFTNELAFPGYDGDQWVDVQRYNDAEWAQLVELWKLYNLHLVRLVSYIPRNVLELERSQHNLDEIAFKTVDQTDPVTLDYFIRDYVDHMRHHLDQIFEKPSAD